MRRRVSALADWLHDRTGWRTGRKHLLDEPLPPGTGWWFTLGSVLLFSLTVQIVTGIALGLFYAPTPDHAWDSVRFVMTNVRAGSLLRGLHHWGASIVVVAAAIHMLRVIFFGSYKKPRELNWIVGLLLLQVILALGLTGYLLPWDQRAYWATVVTINVAKLTPVIGDALAMLLRGGEDIGALTLTRWYALHVLVLPPALLGLIVLHLYLMRRQGISGPMKARVGESKPFFPNQAGRDLVMAILVGALLATLAWKAAPTLEPPADPSSSDYIPRPEWYFLGLFQLLKYFPGKLEVIGALVIPGLAMTFLALLPWIDRGPSREMRKRRVLLGLITAGVASVVTLTILGARDKPAPAAGDWNVREQAGAVLVFDQRDARCARCHTADGLGGAIQPGRIAKPADWLAAHVADPEMIAPGLREPPNVNQRDTAAILSALAKLRLGPAPSLSAGDRQAAVLVNRFCLNCHLVDGVGGKEGPDLSHIGSKRDAAWLAPWITDPVAVKPDTEMPAFRSKMTPDEIRAVAAWFAARK